MKTNNLFLLAAIALAVTFTACEKADVVPEKNNSGGGTTTGGGNGGNNPPPPIPGGGGGPTHNPAPETGALLTKFDMVDFTYDASKRLLTYDSYHINDKYTIVYEGNKAVRLNYESGHHLIYSYENDKVTGAVTYWQDLEIRRYHFEYSGDKMVKKISNSWYPDYTRGWLVVEEYSYDERGNLVELVSAAAQSDKLEDLGPPSYIRWGDYDSKPNPMPYAQSDLYLPGVKLFENNPGYRYTGYKEFFTYSYHESGLPKERYAKLESHPHVPAFVSRYEYQ